MHANYASYNSLHAHSLYIIFELFVFVGKAFTKMSRKDIDN